MSDATYANRARVRARGENEGISFLSFSCIGADDELRGVVRVGLCVFGCTSVKDFVLKWAVKDRGARAGNIGVG